MIWEKAHRHGRLVKGHRSQTQKLQWAYFFLVINISRGLLGLLVIINSYTGTKIDKLVRKQSVYGRTQNLFMNSDRQTEQWWYTSRLFIEGGLTWGHIVWHLLKISRVCSFSFNVSVWDIIVLNWSVQLWKFELGARINRINNSEKIHPFHSSIVGWLGDIWELFYFSMLH